MVKLNERQWCIRAGIVWRNDRIVQLMEARDRVRIVRSDKVVSCTGLAGVYLNVS